MANIDFIAERADLLRVIRRFFDDRRFVEVQPPCLSRDCVVDAYLDPITVEGKELRIADARLPERFFLQTSPESAMKRMLACGAPSIYSVGPVFRSGEAGDLHNVEFTMLEWYEVGGNACSAIELTGTLVASVLETDGFELISYRQVFRDRLAVDPIASPLDEICSIAREIDDTLATTISEDRDELLDMILSERIAPTLGMDRPTIVSDYPLTQAALAKRSEKDEDCAARFELFARGVEVANGYDELLDVAILKERSERNNSKRILSGRTPLQVETTLLEAMNRGLPQCSGVALGVDRLLMLKMGAKRVQDVMPFAIWDA